MASWCPSQEESQNPNLGENFCHGNYFLRIGMLYIYMYMWIHIHTYVYCTCIHISNINNRSILCVYIYVYYYTVNKNIVFTNKTPIPTVPTRPDMSRTTRKSILRLIPDASNRRCIPGSCLRFQLGNQGKILRIPKGNTRPSE